MRLLNDAVGFKHLYAGLNTERGFYGAALLDLYQNPIKILQRLMQKVFTALLGCRMFLNPAAFPGNDEIPAPTQGMQEWTWSSSGASLKHKVLQHGALHRFDHFDCLIFH